jgi:hypothetical protein
MQQYNIFSWQKTLVSNCKFKFLEQKFLAAITQKKPIKVFYSYYLFYLRRFKEFPVGCCHTWQREIKEVQQS